MTEYHDLPLLAYGEQLRDQALAVVTTDAGPAWMDKAEALIRTRLGGTEVLAESFRLLCEEEGIKPHHPNAWGGLTNRLIRHGVLVDTGRIAKSTAPRSHARRQPIWRVQS
jgi:hypothetical protein